MDILMLVFYGAGFIVWTFQAINLLCEMNVGFLAAASRRRRGTYQLIGIVLFILAFTGWVYCVYMHNNPDWWIFESSSYTQYEGDILLSTKDTIIRVDTYKIPFCVMKGTKYVALPERDQTYKDVK